MDQDPGANSVARGNASPGGSSVISPALMGRVAIVSALPRVRGCDRDGAADRCGLAYCPA